MRAAATLRAAAAVLALSFLAALVASGWALMAGYVPSDAEAYASVLYWRRLGGLGALMRDLHDRLASALVVSGFVYLLLTYLTGRHGVEDRGERRAWWRALALYLVVLAACFTGFLLPMDQDAYWGTIVRLGIVESAPGVGPPAADLLRGGPTLEASTLPRFYALHVSILPCLAAVLLWPLLRRRRRRLAAGDGRARWLGVALAGLAAVYLLAVLWPARLELPADPTDGDYVPRPEWYFLWLFELGKVVEKAAWLRSLVLPVAGLGLLAALPLWRQRPAGRLALAAAWCLAWTALAGRALWADRDLPPKLDVEEALVAQAATDFDRRCRACHGAEGRGDGSQTKAFDLDTPDLTSPDFWRQATRPEMRRIVHDGKGDMPAFGDKLAPEAIDALLTFVERSFRPPPAADPERDPAIPPSIHPE